MTRRADPAFPRGNGAARWHEGHTIGVDVLPRLDALIEIKRGRRVRVSAVVPTPADADAGRIDAIAEHLLGRGRADELLVMRSGPAPVAPRLGRAFSSDDVLAEIPATPGRGDAMWRSLAVADGDLVAWLDPAAGPVAAARLIAGAILREDFDLVLGFGLPADPVDALTARPLLTALFPELARVQAPATRMLAGHRRALDTIPFVTADGAEVAVLLDVLASSGLKAIGQVGLGDIPPGEQLDAVRADRITRIILRRADEAGRLRAHLDLPAEGEDASAVYSERPPIELMPTYLAAVHGDIVAGHG